MTLGNWFKEHIVYIFFFLKNSERGYMWNILIGEHDDLYESVHLCLLTQTHVPLHVEDMYVDLPCFVRKETFLIHSPEGHFPQEVLPVTFKFSERELASLQPVPHTLCQEAPLSFVHEECFFSLLLFCADSTSI